LTVTNADEDVVGLGKLLMIFLTPHFFAGRICHFEGEQIVQRMKGRRITNKSPPSEHERNQNCFTAEKSGRILDYFYKVRDWLRMKGSGGSESLSIERVRVVRAQGRVTQGKSRLEETGGWTGETREGTACDPI